ncbi:MAG: hypothetical protein QF551_02400 [Candidatus Marinimicrobia bacterium]|nr:hypothetical protein [Candidatus Neomarinimicrobiota bacterium]
MQLRDFGLGGWLVQEGYMWNNYDHRAYSNWEFPPQLFANLETSIDRFVMPLIFELTLLYLPFSEELAPHMTFGFRL